MLCVFELKINPFHIVKKILPILKNIFVKTVKNTNNNVTNSKD